MSAATLDRTLTALGDPTRRAILKRLSRGDARVTEVARPFTMSLNAVSKHIVILERARLVRRRRRGRDHVLSVNPQPLSEAAGWIESYRRVWEERLYHLETHLREMQRRDRATPRSMRRGSGRRE